MSSKIKIYTDGGSRGNPGKAGIGVVAIAVDTDANDHQRELFQQSTYIGQATNNEAEYKAFLASLEWLVEYVKSEEVDSVQWLLDSKLVVEQINHNWKIKEPRLKVFAEEAWKLLSSLDCEYRISHVTRDFNARADELANKAMDAASS